MVGGQHPSLVTLSCLGPGDLYSMPSPCLSLHSEVKDWIESQCLGHVGPWLSSVTLLSYVVSLRGEDSGLLHPMRESDSEDRIYINLWIALGIL